MGEKPTAAEDALAKSGGGGKEVEAQAAQQVVERDRGIGSPSGRLAHEAAHTPQQESGRMADGTGILPDTAADEAGIAIGDPGVNGNLAGSGDGDPNDPEPQEASNLNASKSNIARATNLNTSRSNAREQGDAGGSGDVPAGPTEAANLNLSKSNID